MAGPNIRPGSAGLTVLELLIALILTGLLSLVAYSSLSLSFRAAARTQLEGELSQELRVSQTILERSLASAVPRLQLQRGAKPYFEGFAQELRWLTVTPLEAHSPAGIFYLRIFSGRDKDGRAALVVEQTAAMNWHRDPQEVELRHILIRNLTSLRFTYGTGGKSFDAWDGAKKNGLPDWVRIELTMKGREPQAWFIPIHVAETQDVR